MTGLRTHLLHATMREEAGTMTHLPILRQDKSARVHHRRPGMRIVQVRRVAAMTSRVIHRHHAAVTPVTALLREAVILLPAAEAHPEAATPPARLHPAEEANDF